VETSPELAVLTNKLRFPEGPIAMRDGSVIVCEIAGGALSRVSPGGDVEVVAELGGGPNGAAIGPDGAIYVCNNGGYKVRQHKGHYFLLGEPAEGYRGGSIQRVDVRTRSVETVFESTPELPLHAPNDIVFDEHGGFYFTDFGKFSGSRVELGALFYGTTDGSVLKRLVHPVQFPNGIGLSPDGSTLYVALTYSGCLVRWTVVEPGLIVRHRGADGEETASRTDRRPGSFFGASVGRGEFDSLAVEADGSVCVATIDHPNGGITTFRSDGRQEFLALPDSTVTNICFGGDDHQTAYATLSHTNQLVRLRWPRPGLRLNFA
jgi:gluconolactonase